MANFKLRVVTPDRIFYDGEASFFSVRTTSGDVGILANHSRYVTPLVIGTLKIRTDEGERFAAIAGGFLKTGDNTATIVTSACEWADEIDVERAQQAADRAKERLQQEQSKREQDIEEIKLKTALNRISVANKLK
ncbi:ATP synthase F1 subunit epsilon [Fumia xinanensis]|uniref:ATP synthase epsilon chain n=1 Tax=Fumia xinanensis TaxID=2763659 RepID=A0A926I3Q7_9FIRM|nr:ATP synthase F1 subunit epsilon [Fumia xinanensis]MBC8560878.1 ATP synthase F1 subunit epsilon [Fumia xinanensis]